MFKRLNHLALASMGLAVALASASETYAQCSGGRGNGGPTSSSPAAFGPIASSNSPNAFAYQQALMQQRQQMYAMQQQMMQQRMQVVAMQRQLMQRSAEDQYAKLQDQYAKQQELVDLRKERAVQKRTERAERIAALKAKRDAEKLDSTVATSPVRFASTSSKPTVLAQVVSK